MSQKNSKKGNGVTISVDSIYNFNLCYQVNKQRELISARKTSHEHSDKDLNRLGNSYLECKIKVV